MTVGSAPSAFSRFDDEGGAESMLFRSDDRCESWRSLCDPAHSPSAANILAVAPDPEAPAGVIVGTDTDVGKTYVGSLIARKLVRQGIKVGVYKPVASGCSRERPELVADDAVDLWEAAGRPANLELVCPQRFAAPLAPHAAAAKEGKQVDDALLRDGLRNWTNQCELVIVEGAGGLPNGFPVL